MLSTACAHQTPTTWVHSFRVDGNRVFSDGELRQGLATQPTGWWPLAKRQPFDEAAFEMDLQRIPAFYADHGFYRARVLSKSIRHRSDDSVDVTVTVDEGRPTLIEGLRVEGFPDARQEKSVRERATSLKVVPGKRVDYGQFTQLKAEAQNVLRQNGYAYSSLEASIDVDRDRHAAIVSLRAQPGPLVHFGRALVQGNDGIPTGKLLRRVTWKPGDRYDPDDLAITQGHFYDTGVFSSVRLTMPTQPTPVADVTIQTSPGRLHELRLGGGLGVEREREEVRLRAVWTFSDFLGGLRRLQLRARPAYVVVPTITNPQRRGPALDTEIQLTQPDVGSTSITLQALAAFELLLTEGYQAYGPRGQIGAQRLFVRDRLLLSASWNMQFLEFFNINSAVFDPARTELGFGFTDPYRLAYLVQTVQFDLRDKPFSPSYGGFAAVSVEEGLRVLGGQFGYTKVTPELRLYAPLGPRLVLAARLLVGWLRPITQAGATTDSPVTRRYALGGPGTHRGFSYGRLAPQIADHDGRLIPVGGNGEVLLSGEARLELFRLSGNWLGVVPFFDAGDVTVHFDQLNLRHLHYATGADLDYQTVIGIVRMGVGFRLNRLSGVVVPDQSPENPDPGQHWVIHFTLGEAF